MSDFSYKARSSAYGHFVTDVESVLGLEPDGDEIDEEEVDLYRYGWRERWQTRPDGSEELVRTPLAEEDLLSPQLGDYISEDTMHRDVTDDVGGILRRRYRDELTVAVWRSLKINYTIPGVTDGPGPDLVVVEGVRDRDRKRTSFPLGKVSGRIRLAMEVVSAESKTKDYEKLPKIYGELEVEEYLVLEGEGEYVDEVFKVKLWRRDPQTKQLAPVQPDGEGRLTLETVGLRVGTGPGGRGLEIWDAITGQRERFPMDQEVWLQVRADKAERRARLEEEARQVAVEAMEQAQQAKREAEQKVHEVERDRQEAEQKAQEAEQKAQEAEREKQGMAAEIERLRRRLLEGSSEP